MSSNSVKNGCIPIFVIKSHKVPNREPVIWETQSYYRVNVYITYSEKDTLPIMTLLQQYYSPICYNNDLMMRMTIHQ